MKKNSGATALTSEPPKCRACGCALVVGENWYKGYAEKHKSYICIKCTLQRNLVWRAANRPKARKSTTAYFHRLNGRFSYMRNQSRKKDGKESNIPIERYEELIKQPCFYCGKPLATGGVGLDRKDNKRGYHLDNVVPCCARCNQMRLDLMSHEEFLEFVAPGIRRRDLAKELGVTPKVMTMILKLYFKTPDVVDHALHDAVEQQMLADRCSPMDDGWEQEYEKRMTEQREKLKKWIKYNEYVWVEIDTDEGTAKVVEQDGR